MEKKVLIIGHPTNGISQGVRDTLNDALRDTDIDTIIIDDHHESMTHRPYKFIAPSIFPELEFGFNEYPKFKRRGNQQTAKKKPRKSRRHHGKK